MNDVFPHACRMQVMLRWLRLGASVVFAMLVAAPVHAATLIVGGDGQFSSIQQAVDQARDGDTVLIRAGHYKEHVVVRHSIVLRAEGDAIVDGEGVGHVVVIKAPRVIVDGLHVIRSGRNLATDDSGIYVEEQADHVQIMNCTIEQSAFGIWINGSTYPQVIRNRIIGLHELISQKRGNGIQFWRVRHGLIEDNDIRGARDGVLFTISHHCLIKNNRISDLRFGVHYMYADKNRVEDNEVHDCDVGLAIMFSKRLVISGNRSYRNGRDGIMFRDVQHSEIVGNVLVGNVKGIFLYNSLDNKIHGNLVMDNEIGVHVWAGSERNKVWRNDFIHNHLQAKYVGIKDERWSSDEGGNFWSDYRGWDLNHDDIGDVRYEPNSIMERLLWRYPTIKLLLNSPAMLTLRYAESQFPVIREPGIVDEAPSMRPFHAGWKEWTSYARH